jgi:hypothetical protein
MVSLSLSVLLASGAVAIDLGYARYVQQQLDYAAQAGAHAGVIQLDGTTAGVSAAHGMAATVAGKNNAAGMPVTLEENDGNDPSGDVVTGVWNGSAFTPSLNAATVNAVQVRTHISELGLFVAPAALGRRTMPVSAAAVMMRPGPGTYATDCFIPLAIPLCLLGLHGLSGLESVTLQLNPPGVDNVAWARPNGSPNTTWSRSQINDCRSSGYAAVGDPVGLQNGTDTAALDAVVTRVSTSSTRWDATRWGAEPARMTGSSISAGNYGRTYEGVMMVFDGGPSFCTGSGGSFTGSYPIAGFMWGGVYDVRNTGSSSTRTVRMRVDPLGDHHSGRQGGGPQWGVDTDGPPQPYMVDPG